MIQRPCGTYKKKGGNACKFISFNNASVTPERSLYLSLIDSLSGIIITWAFVCALQLQTHLSFPCPQLLIMCQRATDKKKVTIEPRKSSLIFMQKSCSLMTPTMADMQPQREMPNKLNSIPPKVRASARTRHYL